MPRNPSKVNSTFRAVYGRLIVGLLHCMAWLPLPMLHALGVLAGWLLWLVPNEQRRIAAVNLKLCFPELSSSTRRRLLRRNLAETAKGILELGPLWLWEGERILTLIHAVDCGETPRATMDRGVGVIFITPHLGAWEVAGLYVSKHYPLTILYRPSRVDIDDVIRAGRERLGGQAVPTDTGGVRALLQALREGRAVGLLPDQGPGREAGLFAPSFGRTANTMTLVSRLAMKSGAPVFLTYAEHLSQGRGYHLHFEPLPAVLNEGPLEASMAALNAAVEQAVRRLPEQYLWVYKRFKSRPSGEPRFY